METWIWIVIAVVVIIVVGVVVYFVFFYTPTPSAASSAVKSAGGPGAAIPDPGNGSSNLWIWLIVGLFVVVIIIVMVVVFTGGSKEVIPVVVPVTTPVIATPVIATPVIPMNVSTMTDYPMTVPVQTPPNQIHFHEQIHFHGTGTDEFDRGAAFNTNDTVPMNTNNIDVLRKNSGTFPSEAKNNLGRNSGISMMRPQVQFSGQGRGATFDPDPEQQMYIKPGTTGRAVIQNSNGQIQQGVLRTPATIQSKTVDPPPRPVVIRS